MADKEYIERGAALDTLLFEMSGTGYQSRAMDAVRFVPAADVVEVVRCKDCTYYDPSRRDVYSGGLCLFTRSGVFEADFCSRGETKGGADHDR